MKLRVKLNNMEFEAEGDPRAVDDAYAIFLNIVDPDRKQNKVVSEVVEIPDEKIGFKDGDKCPRCGRHHAIKSSRQWCFKAWSKKVAKTAAICANRRPRRVKP